MKERISQQVRAAEPELIAWRRHLHQNPELSFQERETSNYIEKLLRSFGGIEVSRPTKTGVVGILRTGRPGRILGLRADIDALPMPEETDLPFASRDRGAMHSCGHDGHTAMLLAAAKLLAGERESLCGEVRFFFQHAEELPPGGAAELVQAGAADGLDEIYGLHLTSNFPTGRFGLRYGALTSATDRFDLTVRGKGGHSAFPETAVDPVVTGAQIIMALQTVISRRTAAVDPAVLSVCQVAAGSAYNIIPEEMCVTGSVRTFNARTRDRVEALIRQIAEGTAQAAGARCDVSYSRGYDSVVNDQALTGEVEQMLLSQFGKAAIEPIDPLMPGEDFSAFLQKCPGCFLQLGSRSPEKGCDFPHHNSRYRMDEDSLAYGVQFYLSLVRRRLAQ